MPRRVFIRFRPFAERIRHSRYARFLGPKLTDSRLWSLNRRAITAAFGAGIAIQFIPLPVHLPLGLVVAMIFHLNVPAMVGTLLLMNPLTVVPIYLLAYRVGTLLLGAPEGEFNFHFGWDWLANGLGGIWKPFLLGCLVCSVVGGYLAWGLMELLFRWSTISRLGARKSGVRR